MKKLSIVLVFLAGVFLITNAQVEFCLPVEDLTLVTIQNPRIDDVEISSNDMSDTLEFRTDMIIEETSAIEEEPNKIDGKTLQVWARGMISFKSDTSSSEIECLAGLPNTRIDITALKGGFHFNDRVWYPKSSGGKAFIICTEDKVIGYNVDCK